MDENFSETEKDSSTKFFSTVRQKNFDESCDTQNIEINGGIDVCLKPLKTKFKTVVSFLTLEKLIKIIVIGQKISR